MAIIYLPTVKACESYGYSRLPKKLNRSNENIPDFLSGDQFMPNLRGSRGTNNTKRSNIINKESNLFKSYLQKFRDDFNVNPEEDIDSESPSSVEEVVVEVLTNIPYITKQVEVNGIRRMIYSNEGSESAVNAQIQSATENSTSIKSGKEKSVATFRILPEGEVNVSHSHEWGEGGGIAKKILDTGVDFANKISRGARTIDRGGGNLNPERNYKLDVNDSYQNSKKPKISLKFVLFTGDDFINDIFNPIMALCYYASPKRIPLSAGKDDNGNPSIENGLYNLISSFTSTVKSAAENSDDAVFQESVGEFERQVKEDPVDFINKRFPGMRILITDPPPFFRVWHTSGLFFYDHMTITDINYSFKKPFYNTMLKNLNIKREFKKSPDSKEPPKAQDNGIYDLEVGVEKAAFPTYAEVEITFEGVDPMFSDDFINLMKYLDPNKANEIVSVIDQTSNSRSINDPERQTDSQEEYNRRLERQAEFRRQSVRDFRNSQDNPKTFCAKQAKKAPEGAYGQQFRSSSDMAAFDCEAAIFESDRSKFCNGDNDCLQSDNYYSYAAKTERQQGDTYFTEGETPGSVKMMNSDWGEDSPVTGDLTRPVDAQNAVRNL